MKIKLIQQNSERTFIAKVRFTEKPRSQYKVIEGKEHYVFWNDKVVNCTVYEHSVNQPISRVIGEGMSICQPCDVYDKEFGRKLAFSRALGALANANVITKEEFEALLNVNLTVPEYSVSI